MPAQRTDVDKRRDAKGRLVEVLLGKAPTGARRFRASVFCRCILRPVETSDAPAGTSLHRRPLHCRPLHCRPARTAAVSAFASFRTPSSVAHRHRFFRWCFLSAVLLFLFPMAATILAVSLTPWGATVPVVLRPSPSSFRSFPHPRFPHTYLL